MTAALGELVVGVDARVVADRYPGIGRYVFELCRALPAVDPALRLVLFTEANAPRGRLNAEELAGDRVALCPVHAGVRSIATQWRLPRAVAAAGIDVFHATYWLTALRVRPPTVLSLYDLIGLDREAQPSAPRRLLLRALLTTAVTASRELLTLSEWSAARLRSLGWDRGRPVTVTPLAPGAHFRPAERAAVEALRGEAHLPARYVLYVGSAKPHKNLRTLLAAWGLAAPRLPGTELVLAGEWGRDGPALRAAVAELDPAAPARCLSAVAENRLAALMTGAAAFAFPSLLEGFGLPPLEAMACGAPVVAAAAASLPEVLGSAARLVDPRDPRAWAEALVDVSAEGATNAELRRRALARASHFSWEITARRTAEAYRRVALVAGGQAASLDRMPPDHPFSPHA